MIQNAQLLVGSSLVGSTVANANGLTWQGGRTALAITAKAFGSGGIYFQMLGADGNLWLNVGGPYGSNQLASFDLPKGTYKIVNAQSSAVNIFAVLATVPY